MLSKVGFTNSDLLRWQINYAGGSLNVNGTIMRDTYTYMNVYRGGVSPKWTLRRLLNPWRFTAIRNATVSAYSLLAQDNRLLTVVDS